MKAIKDIMRERVMVLDGAMGTYIRKFNLKEYDYHKDKFATHSKKLFGFHEILNLTFPKLIQEIHEKYLKAGADFIETNTFRANDYFLEKYDLKGLAYEINFTSAKLAREVANKYSLIRRNKPRFVLGAVGPVPDKLEPEQYKSIYSQQLKGLLAGRVDGIIFETFTDPDNLLAAVETLNQIMSRRERTLPVFVSTTVAKPDDRLMLDKSFLARLVESNKWLDFVAVGENCGFGPEEVYTHIKILSQETDLPVIAYPNAGVVRKQPLSPPEFVAVVKKYLDEGLVNIIGGCCGTTPETIELLSNLVKQYQPRPFAGK